MADPLRVVPLREPEMQLDDLGAPELRRMVRNFEVMNRNLREDLAAAGHWESSAQYWTDSWTELIGQIGDLMHRAKARAKGRRFVTVLEIAQLLKSAVPEVPDDG